MKSRSKKKKKYSLENITAASRFFIENAVVIRLAEHAIASWHHARIAAVLPLKS
jgi:hypothetical protein